MIQVVLSKSKSKNSDHHFLFQTSEKKVVSEFSSSSFGKKQKEWWKQKDFQAKPKQIESILTLGDFPSPSFSLVGTGSEKEWKETLWLQLGALCSRTANAHQSSVLDIEFSFPLQKMAPFLALFVQGIELGQYQFDKYLTEKKKTKVTTVHLLVPSETTPAVQKTCEKQIKEGLLLAEGILAARDLVNEAPNVLNPIHFAELAQKMAKESNLQCRVLDEKELLAQGMNLFLAVGSGSANPPRLVHLSYIPKGKKDTKKKLAWVGKGVTFDSGGLSLKPSNHMLNMHSDMAGAAAVFGAMKVIAQWKPSFEVHGYLACAENMTGSAAFRVNDILVAKNKKTVEIKNTDAEGRLVLADTIAYAIEQGATEVVDLATLTGACLVALGEETAGIMGKTPELVEKLLQASRQKAESMWELPLLENLRAGLQSEVADLSNIGGSYGGAISAGLFLREFVTEDVAWAHIDLAGPSFSSKNEGSVQKGGTGFGVATLLQSLS